MNSKQIASGVPEKTSRREFVRNAAGAAALAVTGVGLAASRVRAGSDRKIRVGIIGCGSVSWK